MSAAKKRLGRERTEVSPRCHRPRQGGTHHPGRLGDLLAVGTDTQPGDARFTDKEQRREQ